MGVPLSPVEIGEILAGKYRIDRILGAGGMGVVVAATHTQLDQKVAIKFLLPEAVDTVLAEGYRTGDIMQPGMTKLGTTGMTDAILKALDKSA